MIWVNKCLCCCCCYMSIYVAFEVNASDTDMWIWPACNTAIVVCVIIPVLAPMHTSFPLHLMCLILYKGLSVPIFPSCFSQTLLDSQVKICRIYNIHVASHIRWGDASRHISFDELVDNTLWRTIQSSLKPPREIHFNFERHWTMFLYSKFFVFRRIRLMSFLIWIVEIWRKYWCLEKVFYANVVVWKRLYVQELLFKLVLGSFKSSKRTLDKD